MYLLAHNWYPADCCSDKDCYPIACKDIIQTSSGYIWDGLAFATKMIRPSQDALCHVCYQVTEGIRIPLCLFIQTVS